MREEREEKSLVQQPGTLGGPLKKKKKKREESGPTESYIQIVYTPMITKHVQTYKNCPEYNSLPKVL
jgi:hypothetical protein